MTEAGEMRRRDLANAAPVFTWSQGARDVSRYTSADWVVDRVSDAVWIGIRDL